ncbi:MAG: hypothetical protein PWQ95_25 [Thermococcaceae archaeon]|nr:hypothetical protein [Thermococcaceae archaeon]
MGWTPSLVRKLSRDELIEYISEVLELMGFKNYERVQDSERWGIDIVALRDDPLAGTEKLLIKIHTGSIASSKDINVFGDLLEKHRADRGIIVSPLGFTKDARSVVAREYRGRVILWDAEKIANTLSNYGIEVPEIEEETQEEPEENPFVKFDLDAPLLFDFSPEEVMGKIAEAAGSRYPIKPEEIRPSSMKVRLSAGYIVSWTVEEGDDKDKALVLRRDEIFTRASSDPNLSTPLKKALLNDSSTIYATEREIETPLSPSEAVLILKDVLSKELGVPENSIKIQERKKVYVPEKAEVELKVGDNRATAVIDVKNDNVDFIIEPLPEEYFIERVKELLVERVGEEPVEISTEKDGWKVKVHGKTPRFNFEFRFNGYTGKTTYEETLISEEALRELIESRHPKGNILSIERGKKVAIADVAVKDGVVILEVNLENGELREIATLPSPKEAFKKAKPLIEDNFPLKGLKLVDSRVVEHKFLELTLRGKGGTARVKIDGSTHDVLDYFVEITPESASDLVSAKYPEFRVVSVSDDEASYTVSAENDTHRITVKVSKDGRIVEESDRVLKRDVAERIAIEKLKEVDETAELKSLELEGDWVAEFQGSHRVGKLVLDRKTGEVKTEDVRFTELRLEEEFREYVKSRYGEENLRTERLTHYKEEGYITIKVAGEKALYYAKIDTKTGEIISEDKAPLKGITAKLKQLQLDGRYK